MTRKKSPNLVTLVTADTEEQDRKKVRKEKKQRKGRGGRVVSMLAFYSDDLSLNPAETNCFSVLLMFGTQTNEQNL